MTDSPESVVRVARFYLVSAAALVFGVSPLAAQTECVGGMAGGFPCQEVDLMAWLPLADIGGGSGNDIWGWTDPDTGKEYALMGRSTGTAFVDISDPVSPVYLGDLPTATVSSTWRDIKVYADHAFIVADAAGSHGVQIFDLTQLRSVSSPPVTFTATAGYSGFGSAHNIAVNEETGFAFAVDTETCNDGLHMIDISNPTAPIFAGCSGANDSVHDTQCVTYHGPDTAHQSRELCFNSNVANAVLEIVDVTNKGAPVVLSVTPYAGSYIAHQGWLTEDHGYFLLGDEGDEFTYGHNSRTHIFDVSDLDSPAVIGSYTSGQAVIDHNLYVRDGFVYEANYQAGLRILDASDVANANLSEVAFFDTYPTGDSLGYDGAWSVYPFFPSCVAVVSDMDRGLFVVRPPESVCSPSPDVFADGFELGDTSAWSLSAPRPPRRETMSAEF